VYVHFDNKQIIIQDKDGDHRYDIAHCPFCGRKL
jgi:hypothetical protein